MKKITFGLILSILVLGFVAMQKAPNVNAQTGSACTTPTGPGTEVWNQNGGYYMCQPNSGPGTPVGIINLALYDCGGGGMTGQQQYPLYKGLGQGVNNACGSLSVYPKSIPAGVDFIQLTGSDSVKVRCNGTVVATMVGPGTLLAGSTNSCPGYTNLWPGAELSVDVDEGQTPILTSASVSGTTLTVYGSNFTSTGNTATVTNSSGTTAVTSNVSSGGSSISFALPTGMTSPGTYSVNVQASGGLIYSNSVSFTVSIPTPTLTSASVSGNIVTVNGSNMSSTGNTVQVSGSGVSTVTLSNISSSGGTTMTFTLPTADNAAGTYSVKVEASGGTAYSNAVSFAVVVPSNLAAQRSSTNIDQIGLTWSNANTGVVGYSIERSFAASGGYTVIGTVSGGSNPSYIDDLSNVSITGANEHYRVRSMYADGTYSGYSNIATVSNCISEGGTGPVSIVFEKGDDWSADTADYISTANNIINQIKSTAPYSKYSGQLSFQADLQNISSTQLAANGGVTSGRSGLYAYTSSAAQSVRSQSSCSAKVYILLLYDPDQNIAYSFPQYGISFLNLGYSGFSNPVDNSALAITAVHELSHALAFLNDEYYTPGSAGSAGIPDDIGNQYDLENCTQDPYDSYADSSGKIYGSIYGELGCGTVEKDTDNYPYFRSSSNSIMDNSWDSSQDSYNEFNTISCGWIVAALDGQALTQANASTHFAECSTMSGIAGTGEFPSVSKPPVVITVGGFSAGGLVSAGNDIFPFMDAVLPYEVSSIHVPTKAHSTANLTSTVIQDVSNALCQGRPAIVVGYSLGSLVTFNMRNDFPGQNVQFIYVDPPYAYSPFFAGFATAFNHGLFSSVKTAVANGIANDSNGVIWTNGEGISNFHNHDPFYYSGANEPIAPNHLSNQQNLINLQNTLLADLGKASTSTATVNCPTIAGATPSSPSVTLTGIESGGNLVTSIAPGDTVSLTGTGFDPNANDIHIEDVNDPTVYYDFSSYAPDSNGNLTFTLPPYFDLSDSGGAPDTISDTYTIQVAGYASDWSNIGTVEVTSTATPPPVPGVITNDPNVPNQYILAGSGYSATGNSVGLTAQSVAMTTPKMGVFNLASALSGFLQSVGSFFTGNTTHKQIFVASIPATQKPTATTAMKTTSKTTSTAVASSVVTKTATVKTATATVPTPDYVITGLPSSGSGVTFQIPGGMPNGVYTVSIRSLNTPWVTTSNTIAVSNNSSGIGATSNISTTTANLTCPTGYTLSGSVCNPNLTPVSLQTSAGAVQNAGSVTLSWANPAYAASASGISIESASSATGPFSVIGTVSALANTYTDIGMSPSQTKYYRIQTMFSGNLYGPYTAVVSTVTPSLVTPSALMATVKGMLGGQIKLTWSGGPDQFYVYDVSQSDQIGTTTDKSYVVSGLQSNTSYCYTVVAHDSPTYISPNSSQACATVPVVAYPAPTSMSISGGISNYTTYNDAIVLNWVLPAKSTSYTVAGISIERSSVSSTTGFSPLTTINSSTTVSYTDTTTGPITSTTYYYRASIVFSNGSGSVTGPYSSVVNTSFILSSFQDYINSAFMNPKACGGQGSKSCVGKFSASQPNPGPVNLSWAMNWAPQTYIQSINHYQYADWLSYGWMSVQRSLAKDSGYTEMSLGSDSSSYIDPVPAPGIKYYYRVEPVIHTKLFGTTYATATAAINITTKDFSVPSVSASATTSSAVYVSWTWKNAGSATPTYTISETVPSSVTLTSSASSYVFDGLAPSTKYCFTVTARLNDTFVSPTSKQVCATTKKATATGKNVTSVDTVTTSNAVTKDATTVSTDNTSSSVTTPVTTPVDTTNTTSPGTTVTSTLAPTVTTSCPAGYLKFGQTCKSLNATVPVTKKYSCPAGYVFDAVNLICNQSTTTTITATTTDSVSVASTTASIDDSQPTIVITPVDTTSPVSTPVPVPATVTYSCLTGYVLNGSQCTLTTTIVATAKKGCPTGYSIINQNCVRVSPPSIILQTTTYSCASGYTLNTDGKTCSSISVTVPATATYSCPTGSVLDNATKTCTQVTSAAFATSTTTASVFDSITHWFGSVFGW